MMVTLRGRTGQGRVVSGLGCYSKRFNGGKRGHISSIMLALLQHREATATAVGFALTRPPKHLATPT